MNQTLTRFQAEGFGKFTEYALATAPFFKAIKPTVMTLTETSADVTMYPPIELNTGSEHNTTDDAALCSLALFAGGLMADASAPAGRRWSLSGFEIDYLKIRQHEVHALADASLVDWSKPGEYTLSVSIVQHVNHQADLVATANLQITVLAV